jgi:hypothetical protein
MNKKIAKFTGFSLFAIMFLSLATCVAPVRAVNINTTQQTFVLSNEGTGYGISALVNAGYGEYNLYDILVAIQEETDPSIAGIITPQFLATLQACPASSPIFTTQLKSVNTQGIAVAISTDGTFQIANVYGSTYQSAHESSVLKVVVTGAGSFRAVYNSTSTPLTSWSNTNAGVTTTYNVFGIFYASSISASQSPTSTTQPTPTPSVPEFPQLEILLALIIVTTLANAVAIKKKKS